MKTLIVSSRNKTRLKTLIIGAGQIGSAADGPHIDSISTHAHAIYSIAEQFELIGIIDSNEEVAKKEASKWQCSYFNCLDSFRNEFSTADLIVIASPTESHLAYLRQSLELKPRGIIVEKPISNSLAELQDFLKNFNTKIPVTINYTRRFLKNQSEFMNKFLTGNWGKFLHGTGTYSKGLFHSGSHLINYLLPILNREIVSISPLHAQTDYKPEDPSLSCLIQYKDSSYFILKSVNSKLYEVFDIDLFFENAQVKIDTLGFNIHYKYPKKNRTTGIQYIEDSSEIVSSTRTEAFLRLYSNMYNSILGLESVICDINDSEQTLSLCNQIVQSQYAK